MLAAWRGARTKTFRYCTNRTTNTLAISEYSPAGKRRSGY